MQIVGARLMGNEGYAIRSVAYEQTLTGRINVGRKIKNCRDGHL